MMSERNQMVVLKMSGAASADAIPLGIVQAVERAQMILDRVAPGSEFPFPVLAVIVANHLPESRRVEAQVSPGQQLKDRALANMKAGKSKNSAPANASDDDLDRVEVTDLQEGDLVNYMDENGEDRPGEFLGMCEKRKAYARVKLEGDVSPFREIHIDDLDLAERPVKVGPVDTEPKGKKK